MTTEFTAEMATAYLTEIGQSAAPYSAEDLFTVYLDNNGIADPTGDILADLCYQYNLTDDAFTRGCMLWTLRNFNFPTERAQFDAYVATIHNLRMLQRLVDQVSEQLTVAMTQTAPNTATTLH